MLLDIICQTERLILRTWQESDAEAYFNINQDPAVTECLPGPMTMSQVIDFMQVVNQQHLDKGYTRRLSSCGFVVCLSRLLMY